MLNVACVRWGSAFGVEYVERLHDMVRRNLPEGFQGRFVCLTDDPGALKHLSGVETQLLPDGLLGWWNKLALFEPGRFEFRDRVLYFDLDTVITGPLEKLANFDCHFGLLRDAYRPKGLQSSVMFFNSSTQLTDSLWDEFHRAIGHFVVTRPGMDKQRACEILWPGGDQHFIEQFYAHLLPERLKRAGTPGKPWPPEILQEHFPGLLRSYKVDCIEGPPKGTSVVFFHGHPRPHEVESGWVPEVWKVGGGSAAELVQIGNVPQEILLANARAAHASVSRWVEIEEANAWTAVIVGGGPSLSRYLSQIASLRQGAGAHVFATNNTLRYLREHKVPADAHVVLDGKIENCAFYDPGGAKYYASIVHPKLLELAQRDPEAELVCWDPATEGMEAIAGAGLMIGGGSTVLLRAICVAYMQGYRKFAIFGADSCYEDGAHHAYEQRWNDGERVLDVIMRGKTFKAAAWMVKQAEEFRDLAVTLLNTGCELLVFGEGLIPWIAEGLADTQEGYEQIGGWWWPKRDAETRTAVEQSLPDCIAYAQMVEHRACVVQAGGNVGRWPVELAKYFGEVYTFEPDAENWECLQRNLAQQPYSNIHAFQEALGAGESRVALAQVVGNPGATYINQVEGDVHVRSVDSLNLAHLDALILDIEGYEHLALMGAQLTIERCRPALIVCELKGHGQRYGFTDQQTIDWLHERGYRLSQRFHRDSVFVPIKRQES